MCVGADLNYRAPSADFPPSSPGFTDASRASLVRNSPSRHLPSPSPWYPCFALADLIRDSALNLVRYTAVCMPQLALPAASATYTYIYILSPSSLFLRFPPAHITYLRILRTRRNVYAKTHIHATPTYIPDRLASCFYSVRPRSLASKDRYTPSALFFPVLSSFSLLLPFPLLRLRILSFSFSPSFCLYLLSLPLYLRLSLYPLVTVSILESKHPRLKRSFYPFLLLSREGTLADAPDVSTVRLLLATDANGVVTTTDVALPPLSSTALLESDLRFSSPLYSPLPPFEWNRASARRRHRRRRRPLVRI